MLPTNKQKQRVKGAVDMKSSGSAYILNTVFKHDIFIPKERTNHALHDDVVEVEVVAMKGDRPEGTILRILERGKTRWSGTLEIQNGIAFVVTDNSKMPADIFIPTNKLNRARSGQKVVANIVSWNRKEKNPQGEIIEVLGSPGEHKTEMNSILEEYGLPEGFPPNVKDEIKSLPVVISSEEIKGRKDFRKEITFTIDPEDAKDFDDAISLKSLPGGNWEVGVHIADVSHYVYPGSGVDEEARSRATSVYLVDRVIPMLPIELSNHACSLNPDEDKLCFSAVFELTPAIEIAHQWFGKTLINSRRRFNYDEVQLIINGKEDPLASEIMTLHGLAQQLRKNRIANGSIPFEKTETKFKLDEKGNPLEVHFVESNEAHELIEEFMLLTNKKVAEFVKKKLFVYRVHDSPDKEKLQKFSDFLNKSGIAKNFSVSKNLAASFNSLLHNAKHKPYENIINLLAIRTMAKAFYTTHNIGHYGLGFGSYTHFTSPIRRYPDLLVHRLLFSYLQDKKPFISNDSLEEQCGHCSRKERLAEEAERTSVKYKQVQFMASHKSTAFDGVISGTTEYGFFVELIENKCEGMVRARDIKDDYYIYDESTYCLRGKRTGKRFQLGQQVRVRVKKTDLIRKQIDFELIK